jgi:hypothetical protein
MPLVRFTILGAGPTELPKRSTKLNWAMLSFSQSVRNREQAPRPCYQSRHKPTCFQTQQTGSENQPTLLDAQRFQRRNQACSERWNQRRGQSG